MAAVAVGVAGAAALAYGLSQLSPSSRKYGGDYAERTAASEHQHSNSYAPYAYEASVDPRESDPSELKHTGWESQAESAAWQDMEWQRDCGEFGSCSGNAHMPEGVAPYSGKAYPPTWGEVQDRPLRPLGTREPDSFLEEAVYLESQRDASSRLEIPPDPSARSRYATHPLDWGGQLAPEEIPYGAQEATDKQFWGAEDWDSYRHSKRPAYLDNKTNQRDGKEINRPLDDFGSEMWAAEPGAGGSRDWGIGAGEFTARDATPRLLAMNRYGSVVTDTDFERPKLLPPTPGAGIGGGNPSFEAEVTLGGRLSRMFSAFQPWKAAPAGNLQPPELADVYIEKSRVLLYDPQRGVAAAKPGTRAHGGISVNPVEGGRVRRLDTSMSLPRGVAKGRVAAHAGISVNPYEGYHYTSRETMEGPAVGRRGQGGNGYLLLGSADEYHTRKAPTDMQDYVPPRGGSKTGTYGGEAAQGSSVPNLRSECAVEVLGSRGTGGLRGGALGKLGIVTLKHNTSVGNRGGDYDDSPIPEQLINLGTPKAVALQVGGRSQQALDDLFDVKMS